MNRLILELLDRLGAPIVSCKDIHKDLSLTVEDFRTRYGRAFLRDRVVVVISDVSLKLFIVGRFEQLFENRTKFRDGGMDWVVGIPQELWDKIQPSITTPVEYLNTVPASA